MDTEKKKILIVDDEVAFTQMVRLNLEGTGKYKVRVENKGTYAVSIVKEFKPDLILLDIIIPDVAGSEIAAQLKEDESTKHIPVVFLTALVTKKEERADGNSRRIVGGNTFVAKPVNLKDLISCIDLTLGA